MPTDPGATYRLQLGPGLGFADVAELVGYLADLGVSHLYLSPLLTAVSGSTHGYDVADPSTVSAALGGEGGLRLLAAAARERGLGLVADIVPNHLGIGPDNPLWELLLAEGKGGEGARVFDVDWEPALPGAAGKVLLAMLGDQYGAVLHRGELEVIERDGVPRVRYYEHSFPLSPESVAALRRDGDLEHVRGVPGQPQTWHRLHALLEGQHYRLVHWRVGDALLNYRRFFAVNTLAGVRVEDEHVFDLTHDTILALVRDGIIHGLRVDHPDGLRDPGRYFEHLAARTGGLWTVAEKILAPDEPLPDWPVAGSTGYEFCNDLLGLFVDPSAEALLDELDREFGADPRPYADQAAAAKGEVLDAELATDLRRLASRLWVLAQEHLEVRDVDDAACREVLRGTAVELPVYRTYVDPETGWARPEDVALIEGAVQRARRRGRGAPPALYGFLAAVLTGRAGSSPAYLDVIARFQQLSGAATAKGVEDTVFYRYRRLAAVNEVGAEPGHLGLGVDGFHRRNLERARRHPAGILSTATHDTKRGEDVRLRMAALSELAEEWSAAVRGWREENADAVAETPAGPAPDPQTEYLLYQTLVGVWPLLESGRSEGDLGERLKAYAQKAAREARQRTSWRDPDEAFEEGVAAFVDRILARESFTAGLAEVAGRAAEVGMTSGLAAVVLRCTSPGVPDTYQGTELWDDSLVDPDNRRPVDFAERRRLLAELDAGADPAELLAARRDGRVKLWTLSRCLRARAAHTACVGRQGAYVPLAAEGRFAQHVVAYLRVAPHDADALLVVAPRLPGAVMAGKSQPPLGGSWGDTTVRLPSSWGDRAWTDILTGAELAPAANQPLAAALGVLPVAVLAVDGTPAGR